MGQKNSGNYFYWYYFLVIVISILPFISIFLTSQLPHTHDGLVHIPRMAAYYKAIRDGQFPVRWAGDLNYGYGLPLFNFIYQVPYLVSSLFLLLGFGLILSFKLVLLTSFLLSGVFMFLFSRSFFEDNKKAFLVTIFYQFYPFRLVELLIRGSFGEVFTYTFLPLLLYGLYNLIKQKKIKYFAISSFAAGFLILSHNAISLVFFSVALLFLLIFSKGFKNLILGLSSLVVGMLLSAFYWIPAIFEHKYTYGDLFMKELYKSHFPPFVRFFIPNLLNDSSLQTGGISVQFGLFQEITILLILFFVFKKMKIKEKDLFIYGFVLLLGSLFFMQPVSSFLWERVSLLRQFQFPWRFLSVGSIAFACLSVSYFYFNFFRQKTGYSLLLFFVIISTLYYWKPNLGFDKINESYYWNFPLNTTYFGETDVIWSAGPAKSYPKSRVEVIGGEGKVKNFNRNSFSQNFTIDAKTNVALVDHTQYFPGWKVFVDNKNVPIEFQDPSWRGEITFSVKNGAHRVKVIFGESPLRLVADFISLQSIIVLLFFTFFLHRGYEKKRIIPN